MVRAENAPGGGARFSAIGGVLGVAGFVVRLGDNEGNPDPNLGRQLQEHAIPGLMPEARIEPHLEQGADGLSRMLAKIAFTQEKPDPATRQEFRVAPPLLGRGLMARVAAQEILKNADPDDRNGDGISGRILVPVVYAADEYIAVVARREQLEGHLQTVK